MTTLILICVFSLKPYQAKSHALTAWERRRIEIFERSIDSSCNDCDLAYQYERNLLYRGLCRKYYNKPAIDADVRGAK